MLIPNNLKYSKEHEWVRVEGNNAVVGISDYAQSQLGDIVFVELPEPGATVVAGKRFSVVESVKAVSDIFSPVSGKIVAVNDGLNDAPEKINQAPYGEGWIVEVELTNADQLNDLADAAAYKKILADAGGE